MSSFAKDAKVVHFAEFNPFGEHDAVKLRVQHNDKCKPKRTLWTKTNNAKFYPTDLVFGSEADEFLSETMAKYLPSTDLSSKQNTGRLNQWKPVTIIKQDGTVFESYMYSRFL